MVTRDKPWPAGTPCWADVVTTDAAAAREFYTALFGWDIAVGGEDTGGYSMASLGGRRVSGIAQMPGEHPAAWTCYLATTDADATAQAITAAGGTLIEPPMDVLDFGRMILATDPTGAMFGVWEAKAHFGAELANETGALVWNEVLSHDHAVAKDFYAAVFGWTFTTLSEGEMDYATFEVDGNTAGGIGSLPPGVPEGVPSHWRNYVAVDDCDAAVARVVELGGSVLRPAADMPFGRHADVADPHGAAFSVITPAMPE